LKYHDVIKAARAALGCSFTSGDMKWLTERIGIPRRSHSNFEGDVCCGSENCGKKCSAAGIEWKIGEVGLTAIMNLKNITKSAEREVDVAARLMNEFAVSIAPNREAFRSLEIGWFGVCFGVEEESLKKRLGRLAKDVGAIRAIAKCFRAFRCHSFPFTASSSGRSRG
jgi:hypothetical protein